MDLSFSCLASWDNLLLAYRKAARGKRGRAAAAAFEFRLEDNLLLLRAELLSGSYRPGPYRSFTIHETKRRLISAAPFRDRVVHHALCNLLEPLFEPLFIADCYANRVGKGTHRALDRAQYFSRRYRYVLQCDVRQFFPSIDHRILRAELARRVQDERILGLVDGILRGGEGVLRGEYDQVYFPGDDLFAALRPRGLPIGNLTSQFWANVFLNPLDHFVRRELGCPAYLRYVDDFLLFSNSKSRLWAWCEQIERSLARLRLTIHPGAHPRPVSEGFPFLGFTLYPQRRRLKRRKGLAFRRKLRGLLLGVNSGALPISKISASVGGWVNHVRYANTVGLRKALLGSAHILQFSHPGG